MRGGEEEDKWGGKRGIYWKLIYEYPHEAYNYPANDPQLYKVKWSTLTKKRESGISCLNM